MRRNLENIRIYAKKYNSTVKNDNQLNKPSSELELQSRNDGHYIFSISLYFFLLVQMFFFPKYLTY